MIEVFIDQSVWFKLGPIGASSKVEDNLPVSVNAYQNKIKQILIIIIIKKDKKYPPGNYTYFKLKINIQKCKISTSTHKGINMYVEF